MIIDINVDLTLTEKKDLNFEIEHAKKMIKLAHNFGTSQCRISLGGQLVSIQNLMYKGSRNINFKSRDKDKKSIERSYHIKLVSITAQRLFSHLAYCIRSNMKSNSYADEKKVASAIYALKEIVRTAENLNVRLGIENHWGISGIPETILNIIETVGSHCLGACLDFGNFPRNVDPYTGVCLIAPKTLVVHVKSYGKAKDRKLLLRYYRYLSVLKNEGFDGPLTIEYEGFGSDLRACLNMKEVLLGTDSMSGGISSKLSVSPH